MQPHPAVAAEHRNRLGQVVERLALHADECIEAAREVGTKVIFIQTIHTDETDSDAWLGRHGAEAIVVWDGEDPAVGRTVRSLQDHLGEDEVWVLEP